MSSGAMDGAYFDWGDYFIFLMLLVVSAAIGVYFGFFGTQQKTPAEYLLGGKTMKVVPVALSLVASHISGATLVGVPAEVYTEGTLYAWMVPSVLLACMFVSVVFIPVFCNLQITSAYEYLELRFNRAARTYASSIYLMTSVVFLPVTLYVPAISLSQATGLNLHMITFIVTFVCVFYTTIGGLKAVVWTDFFQTIVTIVACFAITIIGTYNAGGFFHVMKTVNDAGRLDIFNMDPNPFQRNTMWTVLVGTFFNWGSGLVASQACIQRFISVPTAKDAQMVLLIYWVGITFMTAISIYGGLLVYAVYLGCDPIEQNLVKKADQIYPYYVLDKIGYVPMLPGLFIAGIFSAALSTVSTSLNAIAATLYADYIKRKNVTDAMAALIMKSIVIGIGCFAVIMVFVVEKLGNILAVSWTIAGVMGTPIFTMFLMGMTMPWANFKGAMAGSLTAMIVMSWIAVGAAMNKVTHASKNIYPHINSTCPSNGTDFMTSNISEPEEEIFILYRLSYMIYKFVGIIISFIVAIIVSYITGPTDASTIDPNLICPPMRRFLPKKLQEKDSSNKLLDKTAVEIQLKQLNI